MPTHHIHTYRIPHPGVDTSHSCSHTTHTTYTHKDLMHNLHTHTYILTHIYSAQHTYAHIDPHTPYTHYHTLVHTHTHQKTLKRSQKSLVAKQEIL